MFEKIAEARSKFYWFLSEFYLRKPDKEFIKKLKENLKEINTNGMEREIKEGIDILKKSLEKEKEDNLLVEFTRLFRGIKEGYSPPPPYESVYKGEGIVMGKSTIEVLKKFIKAGFGIIDEYPGPQDYIGTELRFMSLLCYREMEAHIKGNINEAKKYLNFEREFLEEHILSWIPTFCDVMEKESRVNFYKGVAKITRGFILLERSIIEEIIGELHARDG